MVFTTLQSFVYQRIPRDVMIGMDQSPLSFFSASATPQFHAFSSPNSSSLAKGMRINNTVAMIVVIPVEIAISVTVTPTTEFEG